MYCILNESNYQKGGEEYERQNVRTQESIQAKRDF